MTNSQEPIAPVLLSDAECDAIYLRESHAAGYGQSPAHALIRAGYAAAQSEPRGVPVAWLCKRDGVNPWVELDPEVAAQRIRASDRYHVTPLYPPIAAPPATPDKVSGLTRDHQRLIERLLATPHTDKCAARESRDPNACDCGYSLRLDAAAALALVDDASPPAPAVERYRHYKGGEYELIRTALREADGLTMCVYRQVGTDVWWVRPIGEFEMKFAKIAPAAGSPAAGEDGKHG